MSDLAVWAEDQRLHFHCLTHGCHSVGCGWGGRDDGVRDTRAGCGRGDTGQGRWRDLTLATGHPLWAEGTKSLAFGANHSSTTCQAQWLAGLLLLARAVGKAVRDQSLWPNLCSAGIEGLFTVQSEMFMCFSVITDTFTLFGEQKWREREFITHMMYWHRSATQSNTKIKFKQILSQAIVQSRNKHNLCYLCKQTASKSLNSLIYQILLIVQCCLPVSQQYGLLLGLCCPLVVFLLHAQTSFICVLIKHHYLNWSIKKTNGNKWAQLEPGLIASKVWMEGWAQLEGLVLKIYYPRDLSDNLQHCVLYFSGH